MERSPEEWSEASGILSVDLCTQAEEGVAHAGLVAEDSVHERSASTVVPVIHPVPDGLSHDQSHDPGTLRGELSDQFLEL